MGGDGGAGENEIGWAWEHQRVTAVLWPHWIGVRGWCRRLTTEARDGGGGPMRWGDRSRGQEAKCVCADARTSASGA
jgi:hypothetical protein